MLNKKIEKQLKNLKLNSYEVKMWVALLSRCIASVGELADVSGVPRSRSYDVLVSLKKKGFVKIKQRKPIKYTAIPPKEAIERAKSRVQEETKKQIEMLTRDTSIEELKNLHKKNICFIKTADLNGSLKGRQNLYNHIERMLKKAEKHVLISSSPNETILFTLKFKKLFENLKKRKIKVRILTQLNNQTKKYFDEPKQLVELRHTDNKVRFCIVDNKEIIIMLLGDNEVHPLYDIGIWVNTPLAEDLRNIYSKS